MKVYDYGHGLHTRGVPRPDHVSTLTENDWRVVSLTPTYPSHLSALAGRSAWLPMTDGALTPARLDEAFAAAALTAEWARRGRVLVHCVAGRNRSVFVVALAYISLTGCTGAEALAHVRSVRPRCLANPHFEAYLEAL